MPDIPNAVVTWLLGQLDLMPSESLRSSLQWGPARLLKGLLGERELEEVRALLQTPRGPEPGVSAVLLPGVMGSLLASIRGLSSVVWLNPAVVLEGALNLLELDDDGKTDRSPYVEIVPVGIEKITYLRLILSLARESKLYEFAYDWRRHLEWNAQILRERVIRWASIRPGQRFVLVGHSMGGILARTYMALYPAEAEQYVQHVILLASPLRGAAISALAFSGLAPPASIIPKLNPANDVGRLAKGFPGCYQLLPPPPDLFASDRPYPFNWDIYDAQEWHLPGMRQDYLDDARRLHQLLAASDPQVEITHICGCNCDTITDVWLAPNGGECTTRDLYTLAQQETGDDTVPLWSVSADGVSTYYVSEAHRTLPSCPEVLRALTALLHGEAPDLPRQAPPSDGLLRRIVPPSLIEQVTEMRQRWESGQLSGEDIRHLFFFR